MSSRARLRARSSTAERGSHELIWALAATAIRGSLERAAGRSPGGRAAFAVLGG